MTQSHNPLILRCRGLVLDTSADAHVVGILNVTPDSFSDGGRYLAVDAALERAAEMVQEGASAIDIGGASSRPRGTVYGEGAVVVPPEEEMRRVVPVVEGIASLFPETTISVDTYRPAVAEAVLKAGAHMINDITGLRYFPEMADVVAAYDAALVVMHSVGRPGAMPHEHQHEDIARAVCASLSSSVLTAESAGVKDLIVDPGFGFGKTPQQNLHLLSRLRTLCSLKRPVMIGISRKSTVGLVLGTGGVPAPVHQRLYGTLGATAVAVIQGARLVRTHDVRPTIEMLRLIFAVHKAR